jgi:HEAT repeat protein
MFLSVSASFLWLFFFHVQALVIHKSFHAHALVFHKLSQRKTALSAVSKIVSTPNPLSFKIMINQVIYSGKGETFQFANQEGCPEVVRSILGLDGVESLYTMPDWVCVNKLPGDSYSWNDILPRCVLLLGGAIEGSEALYALDRFNMSNEKTLLLESASCVSDNQISVAIKLQISNLIPIQIEASDGLTMKRQALSQRFSAIMEEFINKQTGGKMAFFEGRSWVPQGTLYADTLDEALAAAVDDIEAIYSDERLQSLVGRAVLTTQDQISRPNQDMIMPGHLSKLQSLRNSSALGSVEELCNLASDKSNEDSTALAILIGFVVDGLGSIPARRMAIAYLGSCSGDHFITFRNEILNCLSVAFVQEKASGMRRTAGDSLSDFGDRRCVPLAAKQLLTDSSKLVRWRAARILGELGGQERVNESSNDVEENEGEKTVDVATSALQAAILVDLQSFEVVFECTNSLSLLQNGGGGNSIPVWQKIAGNI